MRNLGLVFPNRTIRLNVGGNIDTTYCLNFRKNKEDDGTFLSLKITYGSLFGLTALQLRLSVI